MANDLRYRVRDAVDEFFLPNGGANGTQNPLVKQIRRQVVGRTYEAGEFIFYEGDSVRGVYYVQEGLVAIRKSSPEGRNTLIRISTPGDVIGYRPIAAQQEHRGSAKVLKRSVLLFMNSETFRALQRIDPNWENSIVHRLATAQGEAEERLHEIATMSLRARLAHLLVMLRNQFHREGLEPEQAFELPISRTDLASMLGVRRESVSRAIHEFEEEGLAHFADRHVDILQPDALVAVYSQKDSG